MAPVLAQVSVEDFDQYIATFSTKGAELRAKHGCAGVTVYRDAEDPSLVFNLFDWTREGIAAFIADPATPGVMKEAGLIAPPAFTYLEESETLDA